MCKGICRLSHIEKHHFQLKFDWMNLHINVFCKCLRVNHILCECCTKHHIEIHNHILQYIMKLLTWFALWCVLLLLVFGRFINILPNRYHSTETYRQTGHIKAPQADYMMTTNNTHWTLKRVWDWERERDWDKVYSTQQDIIQMHDIRHTWQFLCIIQY